MVVSVLSCERTMTLVQLYGHGLSRLGISRLELIEAGLDDYVRTAAWAAALHASNDRIDGLLWVSRQKDDSHSMILFGDRVARRSLKVVKAPLPLYFSPGLDEVQRVADLAGITVVE
jgi:hypothetical protein